VQADLIILATGYTTAAEQKLLDGKLRAAAGYDISDSQWLYRSGRYTEALGCFQEIHLSVIVAVQRFRDECMQHSCVYLCAASC